MIEITAELPETIEYNQPTNIYATITSTEMVLYGELIVDGVVVDSVDTVLVGPYLFEHTFGAGFWHIQIHAINFNEEEATLDLGYVNVMSPDSIVLSSSLKLYDFAFGIQPKADSTFTIPNS